MSLRNNEDQQVRLRISVLLKYDIKDSSKTEFFKKAHEFHQGLLEYLNTYFPVEEMSATIHEKAHAVNFSYSYPSAIGVVG